MLRRPARRTLPALRHFNSSVNAPCTRSSRPSAPPPLPLAPVQVLGHTKTVLVLICGWLYLGDVISNRKFLGMVLAVVGMAAYGYFNSLKPSGPPSNPASRDPSNKGGGLGLGEPLLGGSVRHGASGRGGGSDGEGEEKEVTVQVVNSENSRDARPPSFRHFTGGSSMGADGLGGASQGGGSRNAY